MGTFLHVYFPSVFKKKIKVRREFQRKWAETEKTTLRQMEADRDRQGQH